MGPLGGVPGEGPQKVVRTLFLRNFAIFSKNPGFSGIWGFRGFLDLSKKWVFLTPGEGSRNREKKGFFLPDFAILGSGPGVGFFEIFRKKTCFFNFWRVSRGLENTPPKPGDCEAGGKTIFSKILGTLRFGSETNKKGQKKGHFFRVFLKFSTF